MRRLDTVFQSIEVFRPTVDFPSVGSNATVSADITATGVALGTVILHFAFTSSATDVEDMLLQFMVVEADLIRAVLHNPTGGAIDPGTIDMVFVTATVNPDIDP